MEWGGIWNKIVIPAVQSPLIGFLLAAITIVAMLWALRRTRPAPTNRGLRYAQIGSGSLMAFLHGTNDAQKTMGVIALALYTNGTLDQFTIPWYVKVGSGVALAAGTYVGGWRIMRTMGRESSNWSRRGLRRPDNRQHGALVHRPSRACRSRPRR